MTGLFDVLPAISVGWTIVTAIGGFAASLWAASKIADVKIKKLQDEVTMLQKENARQELRITGIEKDIASALKAVEIKLSELATQLRIYMRLTEIHESDRQERKENK
jgi:hypothetical protein